MSIQSDAILLSGFIYGTTSDIPEAVHKAIKRITDGAHDKIDAKQEIKINFPADVSRCDQATESPVITPSYQEEKTDIETKQKRGRPKNTNVTEEEIKQKKAAYMREYWARKKTEKAEKKSAYIGMREPNGTAAWYPDDWGVIKGMLDEGKPIDEIAQDYGVTVEQLDEYIKKNRFIEKNGVTKCPPVGDKSLIERGKKRDAEIIENRKQHWGFEG